MVSEEVPAHLWWLLFDPDEFFERHPPRDSLLGAIVVAAGTAAVVTVAVAVIGWLFTSRIDATVTETVMEPWPDYQCEGFEEVTPEPCAIDEPKTREVDVGSIIWDRFLELLPFVFVAALLGWGLTAVALHVVSALFGGEGGFAGTLAVAGWATLPEALGAVARVANAHRVLGGVEFSEDPDVLVEQLETLAATSEGEVGILITVVVTVWQAYIWSHGLTHARDLESHQAAFAAGVVAVVSVLVSLL